MEQFRDWRVATILGIAAIGFGLYLSLILFYSDNLSNVSRSDYKWEAIFAVLVGLFFVNIGMKAKRKKSDKSNGDH